MIAKLETGNGFSGVGLYDLRIGKEEQSQVRILGLSGVDYSLDKNGCYVVDHVQLGRDFRFQALMKPSVRKPVYHWALSWKTGEHISDELMKQCAEEFLAGIGFTNTQYIIIRHQKENEHCHLITNIVDFDGNRISTHGLIRRSHEIARKITDSHGFALGEPRKKETMKKAHKPHERARYAIEPKVKEAVAEARSIEDLSRLLQPSGIGCRVKYSEEGKLVGISFSCEMDGQLHTFKGSALDRSLSARKIVKAIERSKQRLAFDFKAARQQAAAKPAPVAQPAPRAPMINLLEILLSAQSLDDLERSLLRRKIVLEHMLDRYGGVSDFRVALAAEGRVVNASSLVTEDQMRQMLDKWEILTGKTPAYKLEQRRDYWKKLQSQRQVQQQSRDESQGQGYGGGLTRRR